jgi:hypothetical protein
MPEIGRTENVRDFPLFIALGTNALILTVEPPTSNESGVELPLPEDDPKIAKGKVLVFVGTAEENALGFAVTRRTPGVGVPKK